MINLALVTGAARGIGLATTQLFLEMGWQVVMADRDGDELEAVAGELKGVHPILCDVGSAENVAVMAEEVGRIAQYGLNALVNNAGVAEFMPIGETDFATWDRVMQVNLDGVFLMSQALTPLLAKARGSIVNISSISGLRASTLRVAYGTSKAAVNALTRQQAVELGELGIRANAVAPGPVRTKLAMAVHSEEIIAAYHDAIPLNRYGSEREIAEAVCFLASDRASYITGQVLAADGGFEATGIGLPALRKK